VIEPLDEKLGLRVVGGTSTLGSMDSAWSDLPCSYCRRGSSPPTRVSTRALLHAMDHLSRSAADLAAMIDTLANAGVQSVSVR